MLRESPCFILIWIVASNSIICIRNGTLLGKIVPRDIKLIPTILLNWYLGDEVRIYGKKDMDHFLEFIQKAEPASLKTGLESMPWKFSRKLTKKAALQKRSKTRVDDIKR